MVDDYNMDPYIDASQNTRQVLTREAPNIIKKKSKCHGNIKLQRFKRKWRSRGLNEEQINELIQRRNDGHPINVDNSVQKKKHSSKKRKRFHISNNRTNNIMKSFSQLSVSRPLRKKTKNEDRLIVNKDDK